MKTKEEYVMRKCVVCGKRYRLRKRDYENGKRLAKVRSVEITITHCRAHMLPALEAHWEEKKAAGGMVVVSLGGAQTYGEEDSLLPACIDGGAEHSWAAGGG
jgi:hypothetical protein